MSKFQLKLQKLEAKKNMSKKLEAKKNSERKNMSRSKKKHEQFFQNECFYHCASFD